MMRIAICDDDIFFCSHLEEMLISIFGQLFIPIETDVFYSGEKLCEYIKSGNKYELIFLDIEFEMMNGVEAGIFIRKKMNDITTQIVYISSKENYAMALFEMHPLNFLIKPIDYTKIQQVVNTALCILDNNVKVFKYKAGSINCQSFYRDIMYFESIERKVRIVLKNETREFYGKLSEIEAQLDSKEFVMIHRSYLVNFLYVIQYQYDFILMANNQRIPISRSNRKDIREKFFTRRADNNNAI